MNIRMPRTRRRSSSVDAYLPRTTGHRPKGDYAVLWMLIPALVFVVGMLAYPVADGSLLSLYRWDFLTEREFVGMRNFSRLFADPVFWTATRNTVWLAIIGPLIQTFLALVIAALIVQVSRGRAVYRTVFLTPIVIALVGVGLIWAFIYDPISGLFNEFLRTIGLERLAQTWLGQKSTALPAVMVMSLWRWTGLNVVIYLAGLQSMPMQLHEAAEIDGANSLQRFFRITVPLIAPFTFVNLIINMLGYLRFFDLIFVSTGGGPARATEVLPTYIYQQAFQFGNVGNAAAATVLLFAIAGVFLIAFGLTVRFTSVASVRGIE